MRHQHHNRSDAHQGGNEPRGEYGRARPGESRDEDMRSMRRGSRATTFPEERFGPTGYDQFGSRLDDNESFDDGQGRNQYDTDYLHWRDEQLSKFDDDYRSWRTERREKFSEDFGKWRNEREGKK